VSNIYQKVKHLTMTDETRINSVVKCTQDLVRENIPGAFVECGVWKGGAMMAIALALMEAGCCDRDLFMFDTFNGMTRPDEEFDVDMCGSSASFLFTKLKTGKNSSNWCKANLDEVKENMASTGYNTEKIYYVVGPVELSLPLVTLKKIALLRLDTDFYKSTKCELQNLFPLLSRRGILIVDDYGHWSGARLATDEYIAEFAPLLKLERCGYTSVVAVKEDNQCCQ
jgi:hypothetical protein